MNSIHGMEIWQTTLSVQRMSCMKARLVRLRRFVLKRLASLLIWSVLFCCTHDGDGPAGQKSGAQHKTGLVGERKLQPYTPHGVERTNYS